MFLNNKLIRLKRIRKNKKKALKGSPQKKGTCSRVTLLDPKKPNSANRPITKIIILKSRRRPLCHIPGETHNLQRFSTVLVSGAYVRDLPGINLRVIRGVYDSTSVILRRVSRSKYGVKVF
jgi:small subunit ribosomal protein S12